jgi:hypothetical protein
VSVFLLFFSRDIVHEIVVETNRYAENLWILEEDIFYF